MALSQANRAKIHIAKKDLAISDEAYRDILGLHFHVASSSALNDRQAAVLLNLFRARGWQPKANPGTESFSQKTRKKVQSPRRDGRYIDIKPGPAAKQQRKVLAMWNALGYAMDKLHTRCKTQFNVDRFEWLTDSEALHILITDLDHRLKSMKKQR